MKKQKTDSQRTKTFIDQIRLLFANQGIIPGLPLSYSELAESLYAKAPTNFLEQHSLEFLGELVKKAGVILAEQHNGDSSVSVDEYILEGRKILSIALLDSPFIIKTFENMLEKYDLKPWALMHPIITLGAKEISLSLIVLDDDSGDGKDLKAIFKHALKALRYTIADYNQTVALTTKASTALAESHRELAAFLHWLTRNSFVFLGAIDNETSEEILGFLKDDILGTQFVKEARQFLHHQGLHVGTFSELSPIHNRKRLLGISIAFEAVKLVLIGVFSSRGFNDEPSELPFFRTKVKEVLAIDDARPNTYDYKQTVVILNSIPKLELASLSPEQLHRQIRLTQEARFFETSQVLLQASSDAGLWVFAALPEERFARDTKEAFSEALEKEFGLEPRSVDTLVTSLNEEVTRLHAYVPLKTSYTDEQLKKVEDKLRTITSGWYGQVQVLLEQVLDSVENAAEWMTSFNKQYAALTVPELAVIEVQLCDALLVSDLHSRLVSYHKAQEGSQQVTFASLDAPITLSQAITILEHANLEVLQAEQFTIARLNSRQCYLQRFAVKVRTGISEITNEIFVQRLKPLFEAILLGIVEDDELSGLVTSAGLNFNEIQLLRTYYNILWQFERSASRGSIRACLAKYPESSRLLAELFLIKFDPARTEHLPIREATFSQLIEEFRDGLRSVKDITDDRILRSIAAIIEQTVRSNFFHTKGAIAHKIHSAKLGILRGAKPMFEIFVFDPAFEGVHLRSSKVSRGGIRWSDRREDYRTEVLGLMRTQRVKNCLIVPSGAKGGFVLKNPRTERKELQEQVRGCYENYIRALLSLADTRVGESIISPKGLLIYDPADPYFVVAADKGTANFSDYANNIAREEFKFWLDDAFASGGSHGYNHKALGITAKGAWESAKVHLSTLNIDYGNQAVSVVGIGDMSGDVFGNGLILTDRFKLLGAFNHAHVFVDPDPDPMKSYQERKRLFALPYSQWTDYDSTVLSPGGAIFNRYDKEIKLSEEARRAFGLDTTVPQIMSGEQLITYLLRAPADLLWNGGIGTYVKSADESDADVNDGANDRVRVNANELRVRAVAEGGNLGFTPRARVEYNKSGGKINSDAIDNSAGVDLSDHEVNLKLFFQPLVAANKITLTERDSILEKAADEVVECVIRNNRYHSLLITIAENASYKSLEYFKGLIRDLVDKGFVQRKADGLPEDEDLDKRQASHQGLTRPELAVILAGVKMWIKQELAESSFVTDANAMKFLYSYFPSVLRRSYSDALERHSLKNQIIATEATNRLVDIVGITFVHRASISQGVSIPQVLEATLAVFEVLHIKVLLVEVEKLYRPATFTVFLECFIELGRVTREMTSWLLSRHLDGLTPDQLVKRYASLPGLLLTARNAIVGKIQTARLVRLAAFKKSEVAGELAMQLADFPQAIFCAEAINASTDHPELSEHILKLMLQIIDLLNLGTLFEGVGGQGQLSRWEHELRIASIAQIRHGVATLAMKAMALGVDSDTLLQQKIQRSTMYPVLQGMITELLSRAFNVAILPAIARSIDEFRLQ